MTITITITLPDLTGRKGHVAWAQDIRARELTCAIAECESRLRLAKDWLAKGLAQNLDLLPAALREALLAGDDQTAIIEAVKLSAPHFWTETKAIHWIDRRYPWRTPRCSWWRRQRTGAYEGSSNFAALLMAPLNPVVSNKTAYLDRISEAPRGFSRRPGPLHFKISKIFSPPRHFF
jgi:hypothetical protein